MHKPEYRQKKSISAIRAFFTRLVVFASIWFVLTGSNIKSWILGIPAILVSIYLSYQLSTSYITYPSPRGFLLFVPFFLSQSLFGAIDVMRRLFSVKMTINPGLVDYRTFLPNGSAQIFFANSISLLPGTLSVDLNDGLIIVHTIDIDMPIRNNLQKLEARVALLFNHRYTGTSN